MTDFDNAMKKLFYVSGPRCWGPLQWMTMHQLARGFPNTPTDEEKAAAKSYLEALIHLIPCSICANHWKDIAPTANVNSRSEFLKWSIDVHNSVNKRTGKKVLTYPEAIDAIMNACQENCLSINTIQTSNVQPALTISLTVLLILTFALFITFAVLYHKATRRSGK